LEAHEQRLIEREGDKSSDHLVLEAHASKKSSYNSKGNYWGCGRGRSLRSGFRRSWQNQDQDQIRCASAKMDILMSHFLGLNLKAQQFLVHSFIAKNLSHQTIINVIHHK